MIKAITILTFLFVSIGQLCMATVDIQKITSPNGIEAWLVQEDSIPFVALELGFKGGTSLDPMGQEGVTQFMMGLLEEGSADMDAEKFAITRDELAASFSFSAGRDSALISARFLTENIEPSIELLRNAIIKPTFSKTAVERVRAQLMSGLRSEETDPDAIAIRAFNKAAFPNHPYGTNSSGELSTITKITQENLHAAHQRVLSKKNLFVGIVGDISVKDAGLMLDRLLGDLSDADVELPKNVQPVIKGGVEVIEFDTPQSVVIFNQIGVDRNAPEFFTAYLLNHIMGGSGFTSRLANEVREKRGLTYGVYSYLASYDHAALLSGNVASANDRVAEAISVIKDEWAKLSHDGVTKEELDAAKKFVTGSYPLRFDGNGPIAAILVGMQMQDLPIDYIATRNERINAVTLTEANALANTLIDPDQLQFTVVGMPEGLEAE